MPDQVSGGEHIVKVLQSVDLNLSKQILYYESPKEGGREQQLATRRQYLLVKWLLILQLVLEDSSDLPC